MSILSTKVEFVADDSVEAGTRHTVDALDVVSAWVQVSSRIPARVAVAMGEHESSLTLNERDTEQHSDGSTVQSDGIFQLQTHEAVRALRPLANLFTLDDSAPVLATLLEAYLDRIVAAAQDAFARGLGKDPLDADGNPIEDVWAYVAVTHNIGPGSAGQTPGSPGTLPGISAYGLDWPVSFQRAHPSMSKQVAYGSDAITGGPRWRPELDDIAPAPGASSGYTGRLLLGLVLLACLVVALLHSLPKAVV